LPTTPSTGSGVLLLPKGLSTRHPGIPQGDRSIPVWQQGSSRLSSRSDCRIWPWGTGSALRRALRPSFRPSEERGGHRARKGLWMRSRSLHPINSLR
jgi:hypothetical protein